jgi:hypothetical protein
LLAVTEYASQKVVEKQGNTYLNEKWADFFKDGTIRIELSFIFILLVYWLNPVEEADRLFLVQFLETLKYFTEIAPVVL